MFTHINFNNYSDLTMHQLQRVTKKADIKALIEGRGKGKGKESLMTVWFEFVLQISFQIK